MSPKPTAPLNYRERTYRHRVHASGMASFQVVCEETDLMIQADRVLAREARELVLTYRAQISGYIQRFPAFGTTLQPWSDTDMAPAIVRRMMDASRSAGVGPMAAVAGAIAEAVGRALLSDSRQVVVENGGDLFVKRDGPVVAALFAGASPLSMRIGVRVADAGHGLGICTSSGTVGHSLSRGVADAVCVISPNSALADATATAIGNRIQTPADIQGAIEAGRQVGDILGIVIVVGERMGAWGALELVPLDRKKG
ncbi:ApbE family lipoprotein [Desulfosarcina cetonica]|uniref:UPF0280 family protein n=1 Tax=Desulfosarcina cetonica TaxID=90730 RepID=UPI0012EE1AE2|nr:UPF0280 family protein [Desulfosarcina cetonica]VTR64651.1 ApbE family lipoprotein [Desulfosarcina cetonica]